MGLINDGLPFLRRDARDVGLPSGDLDDALADKSVRRVFRSVYVDSGRRDDRLFRFEAARLVAPPAAVACSHLAAWLLDVDTLPPGRQYDFVPTFVVPHSTTRITIQGVTCRQAIIPTDDVMEINGALLTVPRRTASDLLRTQWRPYALAAADALAHAKLVLPEEIEDYVARLKGYRGIVQARGLASLIEPLTESHGESWQRLRLVDAGFPRPEPQLIVPLPNGTWVRLDLAYEARRLASEYDGKEFHTTEADRAHDADRRTFLSDVYGWSWVNGNRTNIFGTDPAFEVEVGTYLGMVPLPRTW